MELGLIDGDMIKVGYTSKLYDLITIVFCNSLFAIRTDDASLIEVELVPETNI